MPLKKTKTAAEAVTIRKPDTAPVPSQARPKLPTPEPVVQELQGSGRWRLRVNSPFIFRHHRKNWDVEPVEGLEGVHWLPTIDRKPIVRGVGLIRTLHKGEDASPENAYADEIAKDQRAGWTYLWPNDPAELGGQYALSVPAEDPITGMHGNHYTDPFHDLVQAEDASEIDRAVFNRIEYNKWRYNLVAAGVIKPPAEGVKSQAGRRAQVRIDRATNQDGLATEVRDRVIARHRAQLEAARSAQVPTEEAA